MDTPPLREELYFFGNKTLDWFQTDSHERHQQVMQDHKSKEYIQNKGWDQPGAITYKLNSCAFRSEEFDPTANNLVALGCSFTMGVGLPIRDIWPTLVGQALNLRVCNLGWGGFSADSCFRMAEYWIPYLKPKLVVFLAPPVTRLEIVLNEKTGKTINLMQSNFEDHLQLGDFVKHWFSQDQNSRLNSKKNQLAIEAICNQLNIPVLCYESKNEMGYLKNEDFIKQDYARDLSHPGPNDHKTFTEKIINDFTSK